MVPNSHTVGLLPPEGHNASKEKSRRRRICAFTLAIFAAFVFSLQAWFNGLFHGSTDASQLAHYYYYATQLAAVSKTNQTDQTGNGTGTCPLDRMGPILALEPMLNVPSETQVKEWGRMRTQRYLDFKFYNPYTYLSPILWWICGGAPYPGPPDAMPIWRIGADPSEEMSQKRRLFWFTIIFYKCALCPISALFWHKVFMDYYKQLLKVFGKWTERKMPHAGRDSFKTVYALFFLYIASHHWFLLAMVNLACANGYVDVTFGLNWEFWDLWMDWILGIINLTAILKYWRHRGTDLDNSTVDIIMALLPGIGSEVHIAKDWLFVALCVQAGKCATHNWHVGQLLAWASCVTMVLPLVDFFDELNGPGVALNYIYGHWPIVGAKAKPSSAQRKILILLRATITQNTEAKEIVASKNESSQGCLGFFFCLRFGFHFTVVGIMFVSFAKVIMIPIIRRALLLVLFGLDLKKEKKAPALRRASQDQAEKGEWEGYWDTAKEQYCIMSETLHHYWQTNVVLWLEYAVEYIMKTMEFIPKTREDDDQELIDLQVFFLIANGDTERRRVLDFIASKAYDDEPEFDGKLSPAERRRVAEKLKPDLSQQFIDEFKAAFSGDYDDTIYHKEFKEAFTQAAEDQKAIDESRRIVQMMYKMDKTNWVRIVAEEDLPRRIDKFHVDNPDSGSVFDRSTSVCVNGAPAGSTLCSYLAGRKGYIHQVQSNEQEVILISFPPFNATEEYGMEEWQLAVDGGGEKYHFPVGTFQLARTPQQLRARGATGHDYG